MIRVRITEEQSGFDKTFEGDLVMAVALTSKGDTDATQSGILGAVSHSRAIHLLQSAAKNVKDALGGCEECELTAAGKVAEIMMRPAQTPTPETAIALAKAEADAALRGLAINTQED